MNESDLNVSLALEEKVLCNFEGFNNTMLREYFSWIGLFTNTKKGAELLIEHKIFNLLKKYISKNGFRDHILRVILLCINYTVHSASKDLLTQCLADGSVEIRKVAMTVIRFLYRSENKKTLI